MIQQLIGLVCDLINAIESISNIQFSKLLQLALIKWWLKLNFIFKYHKFL